MISVVFHEGHCISQWGNFRPEYRQIHTLRYRLPNIPFLVASATLPSLVIQDIISTLQMNKLKLLIIRRPTDRPNIQLVVKQIKFALNSYQDLAFLVPGPEGCSTKSHIPSKFVVFFDSITKAVQAGRYLRSRLPPLLRHKIAYFHSKMSQAYKEKTLEKLKKGEIWSLCATDSFGMVSVPLCSIVF